MVEHGQRVDNVADLESVTLVLHYPGRGQEVGATFYTASTTPGTSRRVRDLLFSHMCVCVCDQSGQ